MLYFVATPIGNLKDISLRAIDVLKSVDIIACEDTRNSLKLLLNYDIKKQLISYNKDNEKESAEGIIKLLKNGKEIAVVSDCGMPLISDPGNVLTKRLNEENISYTIIPGANAGLCALLLSGFDCQRFTFVGFLPEKIKDKKTILEEVKNSNSTIILYISPHSLKKELNQIADILGTRRACLVKEITKIHESKIYFNLGEDIDILEKGEFVLVIERQDNKTDFSSLTVDEHYFHYIKSGLDKNSAIKQVAKDRNVAKNIIYNQINCKK